MGHVTIAIGAFLVLFTLADTFFTVLNYNERGILVNSAIRLEWRVIHWFARPLPLRTRIAIYRALTGVTVLSGIVIWVAGIVLGFAFIFYGEMQLGRLKSGDGAPGGPVGALYYSMAQFSTVGAAGVTPESTWVSILSVAETMLSVLLLSLVITYLVHVFTAIQALRNLCACFPSRHEYVTAPLSTLAPFLPREDGSSLEAHLATCRQMMNGYFDAVAADHSSVFFYSGKARFAMPFAIFMLAGTLEGLQYGLPRQHPMSLLPELSRLHESFDTRRKQVYDLFRWPMPVSPTPLEPETFASLAQKAAQTIVAGEVPEALRKVPKAGFDHEAPLPKRVAQDFNVKKSWKEKHKEIYETDEQYAQRFVKLRFAAGRLARIDPPTDWVDLHQTYVHWLGFAAAADDLIRRTSELFDYHPACDMGDVDAGQPLALYGWTRLNQTAAS